jgi:hypothetical protein
MTKLKKTRQEEYKYVACLGEMRNVYDIFAGKPEYRPWHKLIL